MKKQFLSMALALALCLGLTLPAAAAGGFDWDGAAEVRDYEAFAAVAADGKVEKIKITGEVVIPETEEPILVETPILVGTDGKLAMAPGAVMYIHVPMGQFYFEDAQNTWSLLAEACETFVIWHPEEDTYNRDMYGTQPDINQMIKDAAGEPVQTLVISGGDVTLTENLTAEAGIQIIGHNLTVAKGVKVEAGFLRVDGNLTLEEGASLTLNGDGSGVGGDIICADKSQVPEDLKADGEVKTPAEETAAPAEDEKPVNPFADVPETSPFYDAILWAVDQGITNGVSAGAFAPGSTCTRAQIITFLWRSAGKPAAKSGESPFSDVSAGSVNADYYSAILWAGENGIAEGETFKPGDPCTRAMAVEFIWKSAVKDENETIDPPAFTDVAADSSYRDAIAWAVAKGITNGTGDGTTFSPNAACTRGQIVTFLYRTANIPAPMSADPTAQ